MHHSDYQFTDDERAIVAIISLIQRHLRTRSRLSACVDCLSTVCNLVKRRFVDDQQQHFIQKLISQLIDPLVGCILLNEQPQQHESITVHDADYRFALYVLVTIDRVFVSTRRYAQRGRIRMFAESIARR